MEGPSPIIQNLLFNDVPPRITFTYDFNGTPKEMSFTPEDVRTRKLRAQPLVTSDEDCETYVQTCDYVVLFLDEENQSLYRQWCNRHSPALGNQPAGT